MREKLPTDALVLFVVDIDQLTCCKNRFCGGGHILKFACFQQNTVNFKAMNLKWS